MPDASAPERLREAIQAGNLEAVQALIESDRAHLHTIIVPGPNRNYRPLTTAAVQSQLPILSYLVEQGCSVSEAHNYPMFRAAL